LWSRSRTSLTTLSQTTNSHITILTWSLLRDNFSDAYETSKTIKSDFEATFV
jgi:hypothetical protein